MTGQEWVTLLTFGVGAFVLSLVDRQTALMVVLAVGAIILLRSKIGLPQPYSSSPGLPGKPF